MEVKHISDNGFECLLFDRIDCDSVKTEMSWLEPVLLDEEKTGGATINDKVQKKNKGVFITELHAPLYQKCSPTAVTMQSMIEMARTLPLGPSSQLQHINVIGGLSILFSAYKNGDYYKPHYDQACLTLLLWPGIENFSGGDLVFPDFDRTIRYKSGSGLMFPSHYQHEVTQICSQSDGFVRYCATAFITP